MSTAWFDHGLSTQERDEGQQQGNMGEKQPGCIYASYVYLNEAPKTMYSSHEEEFDFVEFFQVVSMTPSGKSLRLRALKVKQGKQQETMNVYSEFTRPRGVGKFRKHSKIFTARLAETYYRGKVPNIPRSAAIGSKIVVHRRGHRDRIHTEKWDGLTQVETHLC